MDCKDHSAQWKWILGVVKKSHQKKKKKMMTSQWPKPSNKWMGSKNNMGLKNISKYTNKTNAHMGIFKGCFEVITGWQQDLQLVVHFVAKCGKKKVGILRFSHNVGKTKLFFEQSSQNCRHMPPCQVHNQSVLVLNFPNISSVPGKSLNRSQFPEHCWEANLQNMYMNILGM